MFVNNNNNRQSVSNYVYNKRRNRTPEPARNENNFANRNNNMPQNHFNNQPSQNTYNNYNQPPQNNFNANPYNNQPLPNAMPTYQGYDSTNSWGGGAVEVPINRATQKTDMLIMWLFLVPLIIGIMMWGISSVFQITGIVTVIGAICFAVSFFGLLIGAVVSEIMEDARKRRVCTAAVTGQLAGYDSQRRHSKHHHYTVYAPKYKIFINNRYEIRTLDRYTRNQNFASQMFLLANPDGYEIIPGGNGGQPIR